MGQLQPAADAFNMALEKLPGYPHAVQNLNLLHHIVETQTMPMDFMFDLNYYMQLGL